jgi:hypothetical protein
MSAWGEKAFENDSALDWLAEFEREGVTALRSILSTVAETDEDEYLDVDDGAGGVAAAEIVAAAVGRGRERVPKQVATWLHANAGAIHSEDVAVARRAIERVVAPNSELGGLWDRDTAWNADIRVLLTRLGGDPAAALQGAERERGKRRGTSAKQDERPKTVILTFLRARGLEPSEAETARIQASNDAEEVATWLARVVDAASVADMLGEKKQ